jgi:hypothetical protein
MLRSIVLFLLLSTSFFLNAQKLISIDSISNYVGQHIVICDNVTDIFEPTDRVKNAYSNFGGKYPDHKFTVVIFETDLPNFIERPVLYYRGKNICVQGMITFYREKPQIVARHPEQIMVVFDEEEID